MAGGVQFYGIDKVMEMFDARKVDAWSIWHGREYLFKGHGDGELRTILESLKNSFNDPIYTLKVYEGFDTADKIKSNTPHDGSFNFKINVPMEVPGMGYVPGNSNYLLIKRIEELEKQRNDQDPEIEDEPETIGSAVDLAIIDLVKNPERALTWIDVFKSILNPGYKAPERPQLPQPAAIGNVAGNSNQVIPDEEKTNRLVTALDTLEKADPQILLHLEKLAQIATTQPTQFKFLIDMLGTLK